MNEINIVEFLTVFNDKIESLLWGGSETGWWSMLVPTSAALGAVLSIILAARTALTTMTENKKLEVQVLLRPLGVVFILSNWFAITFAIYQITRPIENWFKAGYELQQEKVDALQQQRKEAINTLDLKFKDLSAEAILSEKLEKEIIQENTEDKDRIGEKETNPSTINFAMSYFGDLMNDTGESPTDSEGHVKPKISGSSAIQNASLMNMTLNTVTFLGKAVWTIGVFSIFLIRNMGLAVLVIFGPVYISLTLMETWKDAWTVWIGRYVSLCIYGGMAYLCMTFALFLIEYALITDIECFRQAAASDESFFSYIRMMQLNGLGTIALYIISMFVGFGSIKIAPELATWIIPSDVMRTSGNFIAGIFGYTSTSARQLKKVGKKIIK